MVLNLALDVEVNPTTNCIFMCFFFVDTKRRAREEASRKVLRRLHEGINMLDKDSVTRLSTTYAPLLIGSMPQVETNC